MQISLIGDVVPESGKRKPLDAYYTPDALASALVDLLPCGWWEDVLEPSAGGGAFCRAALEAGAMIVTAVDLNPDAPALAHSGVRRSVSDFLDYRRIGSNGRVSPYDAAIGNPPFARETGRFNDKGDPILEPIAIEHVVHALSCVRRGGDVAFLLRWGLLCGGSRAAFWRQYPPWKVWPIAQRPRNWPAAFDYGWYWWRKGKKRETKLGPPVVWR